MPPLPSSSPQLEAQPCFTCTWSLGIPVLCFLLHSHPYTEHPTWSVPTSPIPQSPLLRGAKNLNVPNTTPLPLGPLSRCFHPSTSPLFPQVQSGSCEYGGPLQLSSPAHQLPFSVSQFETAQSKTRRTHSSPEARLSGAWLPLLRLPLRQGLELRKNPEGDKCEVSHPTKKRRSKMQAACVHTGV